MKQNEINLSFYLKRTSPKKELKKRAVYITIAFRGTQIKMSTGILIEDPGDYWKSGMFTHPKFYEQNTKMYKIKEQILAYDATHFKTAEDIRNAYEGVDIHETPLTIFEALDFGLQFKIEEGLQAETTSKSQRCIINKFERFRIAKKAPNWGTIKNHPRMLSRGVVKQFIKWLSDPSNGECNGAMKATTINNYIGVLGANYEAYYKQHIDVEPNLINNPFYGNKIKIDAQESTDKALSKAIDWKWIEKIEKLRYQPIDIDAKRSNYEDSTKYNEKFRLIVLLLVYTGMAFVELGKKDVLEVTNSLEGPMLKNRRKKTGKNYMVPLTKKIAQVIEDLGVIPWEPFIDSRFKMVDYRLYKNSYKVLSRFCEKLSEDIGLDEPFTCHDLRHTFAMRMINHHGIPIRAVARMLGDSEEITRKHYGDYSDEFIAKEINDAMIKLRESEDDNLGSEKRNVV